MAAAGKGAAHVSCVDISQLWLADGTCEQLVKRCESLRDQIDSTVTELGTFAPVSHAIFGDCEEGRGWARLIQQRAAGDAGSVASVLARHREVLAQFADTFRRIESAYREAERGSAGRMARTEASI